MTLTKLNIALCAIMLFFSTSVSGAKKRSTSAYPELSRYVGTERIAPSPARFTFDAIDSECYLTLTDNGKRIVRCNIKTGKELETVMSLDHTRNTTLRYIEGFTLSPDGSKVLVWCDSKNVYRRSYTARYFVYEVRSRILTPLSENHSMQQTPVFSPDGRMIAFVSDGNIYLKKLDYGTEVAVTSDGKKNEIINGVPDWTYEEEFATTCSMAWSPDNLTLSFLKYNESKVPLYGFTLYEGSCDPMSEYALYPGTFNYKYPVAGQPNSVVTLHSYDVETRKTKDITLPGSQTEYVPRIAYGYAPDRLIVTTLNRDQTRMELYSVNPRSTTVKSILVEQWSAWLAPETYENLALLSDGFVMFSCRTGFMHLYKYSYSGTLEQAVTSGDFDVDRFYGYNATTGDYFVRSTATGAINRVVSRVDRKGTVHHLSPAQGYADATFNNFATAFALTYSNAATTPTHTMCAAPTGKSLRQLTDPTNYQARWIDAPTVEFFTCPTTDNVTLNGYIIKPRNFDASQHYPVIMYQYSGPGSQEVLNRWSIGPEKYFAHAGYVVICVDGRGTGGRGRKFQDVVYRQLGYYESIDQLNAARYAASLPFVDAKRIAIYGWSYGGYEAIMAASQPDAPYAAVIAVAPVTDWRYYDTVYAERYMLTPQQNEEGYNLSSALSLISTRNCPLLIMHGTADDNVHLFNTIRYQSLCESLGTWCDLLLFPNMNHSINGCNSREVVFARLLDYLDTHMK